MSPSARRKSQRGISRSDAPHSEENNLRMTDLGIESTERIQSTGEFATEQLSSLRERQSTKAALIPISRYSVPIPAHGPTANQQLS